MLIVSYFAINVVRNMLEGNLSRFNRLYLKIGKENWFDGQFIALIITR